MAVPRLALETQTGDVLLYFLQALNLFAKDGSDAQVLKIFAGLTETEVMSWNLKPIHLAIEFGCESLFKKLIKTQYMSIDANGLTPLMYAAKNNRKAWIKNSSYRSYLLKTLHQKDKNGYTALCWAIRQRADRRYIEYLQDELDALSSKLAVEYQCRALYLKVEHTYPDLFASVVTGNYDRALDLMRMKSFTSPRTTGVSSPAASEESSLTHRSQGNMTRRGRYASF